MSEYQQIIRGESGLEYRRYPTALTVNIYFEGEEVDMFTLGGVRGEDVSYEEFAESVASHERAIRNEDLAEEFEENALNEVADYLRDNGGEATREWIKGEIARAETGDPYAGDLHNLEVAQDRLVDAV